MKNKLYEGWEVAKILSKCEFEEGQKLKDNFGNEYEVAVLMTYESLKGNNGECKAQILTNPDRKFYLA